MTRKIKSKSAFGANLLAERPTNPRQRSNSLDPRLLTAANNRKATSVVAVTEAIIRVTSRPDGEPVFNPHTPCCSIQ